MVAKHMRCSFLHFQALRPWAPWSGWLCCTVPPQGRLGTLFGTAPALTCVHGPFQPTALPILHTLPPSGSETCLRDDEPEPRELAFPPRVTRPVICPVLVPKPQSPRE